MQGSKIRLSDAEMELFRNAEIILTKNSIVQKTVFLLQQVQEALVNENVTRDYQLASTPKISKGENYLGLPYVVLDYPRISNEQNLLFIRSMCWWGNFFSSTLQVSGTFKNEYENKLIAGYEVLSSNNYFIGINSNPWLHHFGEDNYKKIGFLSKEVFAAMINKESAHIKIAAKWPLNEWDSAANKLIESWKLLMELVA